ncbi:hypothetical protein [Halorussus aquaticus]|uniref:Uncharacterized protein n=1 Tax=Halorussus aquaticus TaxID=2953748 RepID=A0ABD5Q8J0_9EURY|nr:hypothetical protein [Halorussus aquaticus]
MKTVSIGHRSRVRNATLTGVLLGVGYVLPFIAEHLSGPRGVGETLQFLIGHTYFHFYLLCVALTVAVMGVSWYFLETPSVHNYAIAGLGYGLVTGVVFSAVYLVVGTQVYSFTMVGVYLAILLGIGVVVGTVAGVLRHYTIGYRS